MSNTTVPTDNADESILRAMRADFINKQLEKEPETYLGVEDAGCTENQYRRMVL